MIASAVSVSLSSSIVSRDKASSLSSFSLRNPTKPIVSALSSPYRESSNIGLSSKTSGLILKLDEQNSHASSTSYGVIEAKTTNPPIMPAVMTPGGPLDLSNVLFRNRIIFIGQPVNAMVAQRVISQLVTLASIDKDADILVYLNCPGGSTYSVLAIYDCMSWIKPKVGTVCFGVAASQGALLLAGGEKGMRYAMPNARIMIHQPQGGCGKTINVHLGILEWNHRLNQEDFMKERAEKLAGKEDDPPRKAQKWIEDQSKGAMRYGLGTLNLKGLQAIHAGKGLIQCDLVVPDCVSDKDGNWHVGAISTLIDDVAAAAVYSFAGHLKASVDFSISFYSTAKIQEEVGIEAKVVGEKGRLSSVVVEIRRKSNGELIALGKQWMSAASIIPSHLSKI